MKAFIGLLRKDLTIIRNWYLTWFAFMLVGMVGIYVFSVYVSEPSIPVPFLVMMASLHLLLAPLTMLTALNSEGKTQLWLYNPQSSAKLLLSKLSAAAVIQLLAQFFILLYAFFVMKILLANGLIDSYNSFLPVKQGLFMQLGIFAVAIYFSVWVIFLWTLYHLLGKYPAIKNFRWLAVLLVWFAFGFLETLLSKTKLFKKEMFFSVNINISPKMDYGTHNSWNIVYTDAHIPLLIIGLYAVVAIIVFLLASWLLDRKVEV
ncbi:hypothetical protein [Siminovitchia fortis]|uniref:hypothetical protein n=1 Tax=Siminovitchia fortis TaxID=254758 RepID=UPI0011A20945|nr:hypothetical protein [Siminovitchia fortis]